MKYCIQAELKFTTKSKRDDATKEALTKFGLKKVWGETSISEGIDEDGYPTQTLEARFDEEKDTDEVFAYIKDKMIRIPVLGGVITKHPCPHDEGKPCDPNTVERFEI